MSVSPIAVRAPARPRRVSSAAAGIGVALLAGVVLIASRHDPSPAVPPGRAVAEVLRDPAAGARLRHLHWTRAAVTPVDPGLVSVTFYDGGRVVFDAALRKNGTVRQSIAFGRRKAPYGSPIAYAPAVLALLSVLFALMTGVTPWRRVRNADAAAVLAFLASVVLLDLRYVGASMLAAAPPLLWLGARCAWRALGPPRAPAPSTPLFTVLAARFSPAQRLRVLRWIAAALAAVFVLVVASSPSVVDVGLATLNGATDLLHGVLPYGHITPDVVRGDSYPLLNYLLYVPVAALGQVRNGFDSLDGALYVALGAALLTAWLLARATLGPAAAGPAAEARARAVIAWLAFPPLLITASTGTNDVVLAAMLVGALLALRRPGRLMALLAAAAWFKAVPAILLPVWLASLRGRALARGLAGIAVVSAVCLGVLVAVDGPHGVSEMLRGMSYQLSRRSPRAPWTALGVPHVALLFEAAVLGLLAGVCVRVRREPGILRDPRRAAALAGALLIGVELSGNYWAFLYTAWTYPLVAIALLA